MGIYRLSKEAEADLIRIHQWGVRNHGEARADQYFAAFFDHFEQLAELPLLHPVSEIREGYRRSVCGKDSVFYRIDSGTIEIMAVIGRQDFGLWL